MARASARDCQANSAQPPQQQTILLSPAPDIAIVAPDLLARLQPATRAAVLALGRPRDYRAAEFLFKQGDVHDGIYLIEAGLVKSFYASEDGRELTLGFWTQGHYVGAPQVFGGGRHAWTSIAMAPTRCLELPGAELRELSSRHTDLALGLIDALVHKTQCYCALLHLLATHSMRVRLARLLPMLAARGDMASFKPSEAAALRDSGTTVVLAATGDDVDRVIVDGRTIVEDGRVLAVDNGLLRRQWTGRPLLRGALSPGAALFPAGHDRRADPAGGPRSAGRMRAIPAAHPAQRRGCARARCTACRGRSPPAARCPARPKRWAPRPRRRSPAASR